MGKKKPKARQQIETKGESRLSLAADGVDLLFSLPAIFRFIGSIFVAMGRGIAFVFRLIFELFD